MEKRGGGVALVPRTVHRSSALLDSVVKKKTPNSDIVIMKDRKTGEDLMLLPLVRRRAQLLRFLEIPDVNVSDYNSPIISRSIVADKARVAEVWDTAMRALPASDVLYLQKIPQILSDVPNSFVARPPEWPPRTAGSRLRHKLRRCAGAKRLGRHPGPPPGYARFNQRCGSVARPSETAAGGIRKGCSPETRW